MKTNLLLFVLNVAVVAAAAEPPPPVYQQPPAAAAPAATPAPPPTTPAKRSAADLEKLVAPIALYPDPLIATMLPASVYPLEIVQAARFVANTNNLAKLDEQPWDDNVKAVARVPDAIKKMNDELSWTMELGEAFLAQDKDIMDAIQAMRNKAQKAGTLQTTPQQIVIITNMLVEKTVEQKIVFVTNTVVQIQPASSTVVYVPAYNPYTVYYPPPAYVYNPMAPLVTFTAGVAMGVMIANNVNWYHGGCYHNDVNINVNNNYNQNNNFNKNSNNNLNNKSGNNAQARNTSGQTKWQPDQSRLSKSGAPSAATSARNAEARGYGSGGAQPSAGTSAARPATGTAGAGARPSTGTPPANRPAASPAASRPAPSAAASRPAASPSASPSTSSRPSSSGSAYGGVNSGSSARADSSRGTASRSGGGGGGGGSRGGGGRR